MIYLKGWRYVLGRQASSNDIVTVLDLGPVFRLARLREFGPEITKSQRFEKWWNNVLCQWATLLDLIIWLDAPNAVLLERIHARKRWHAIKDQSEQGAYEFLARYRTCYEEIIAALASYGGSKVLRFDTSRESLQEVAERVLGALAEYEVG